MTVIRLPPSRPVVQPSCAGADLDARLRQSAWPHKVAKSKDTKDSRRDTRKV